jgi:hypothetical protein
MGSEPIASVVDDAAGVLGADEGVAGALTMTARVAWSDWWVEGTTAQ